MRKLYGFSEKMYQVRDDANFYRKAMSFLRQRQESL